MLDTPRQCPACNGAAAVDHSVADSDTYSVRCLRCGEFQITGSANAIIGGKWARREIDSRQSANLSGWIREHRGVCITEYSLDDLLGMPSPVVGKRAEKLLLRLAEAHPDPGEQFELDATDTGLLGMAWAKNDDEVRYLLDTYLAQTEGLVEVVSRTMPQHYRVVIAPKGWAHIESLRRTVSPSNSAFIAMWFDEKTHDLREKGLKPALAAAGYDPLPIDEKFHSNRIDAEIVATIRESKLVVADLHGDRGGVYYEAGFAMGLNIPVFWTCCQSDLDKKLIHFDVRQYPFEVWDEVNWDDFAKRLRYRIESVLGRGNRLQSERTERVGVTSRNS